MKKKKGIKVGQEILIRARVIKFDPNPHGSSLRVEVNGFQAMHSQRRVVDFWIHQDDQDKVIVEKA